MRKFWLSLMGLTMIFPMSFTTISCGTQPLGWNRQQYWMVLNYQVFHDWMKNVDLVSQNEWEVFDKKKSWEMVQNVDLNNFMTIMNLVYAYLVEIKNHEKLAPVEINQLGGFYHNFGYALLDSQDSFASHLLSLKYEDQFLIAKNSWEPLTWEEYEKNFKTTKINNLFNFKDQNGKLFPIKMDITASDGRTAVDQKIIAVWAPIIQAIQDPTDNSDSKIKNLWTQLKSNYLEAFIFNFHLYWPTNEDGLRITFQINLTFDF